MYSHADRLRAVDLYIKLGKRVKATIRQLGYPTKNALRNWCREYEQHRGLRVRSVARAPKFSEAQKQAALEHYRTHDRCISSTMRTLGYPGRGTLTAWVREAFPEARTSMAGRSWRPAYSDALKQVAVLDLCNREESAQEVADRLGVCRPTLYSWRNELLGHEVASSMKRRNGLRPSNAMFANCSSSMIC
ncbi:helix-turn-helix domain-containing protein [Rhizobium sp. AC27/96]|uniref:helix-turn-helix domain-containing protein n=1 Tax=Rhizobium sp. AC27/96 TaxID=1841653 RepID=UPI000AC0244F